MKWQLAGVLLVVGICLAEIELPAHPQNLDDIPQIKEKCQAKGKPDSYDRLKTAINETRNCLQSKINPEKIKEELEEAKKTGSMDEVFGKYCNKRQEYKNCIMTTVNITKECMEEVEIAALDKTINVIEEVIDFACYKDGDRLAMFVAEGGPECLSSRTEQIKQCMNSTLKIDTSSFSITSLPTSLPSLKIDKKKCDDLNEIRTCVVEDLEKNCQDTTPANIVDALFKFIKKTTCKNVKQRRSVNLLRLKRSIPVLPLNLNNIFNIHDPILEECKRFGGEQAAKEAEESYNKTKVCINGFRLEKTPMETFLNGMTDCSQDLMEKVKNCIPDEMNWYPSFILNFFRALATFVYEIHDMLKMYPLNGLTNCMQRMKSSEAFKNNEPICKPKDNQTDITQYVNSLPDKETLCKILTEADECISEFVGSTCTLTVVLNRTLNSIAKVVQAPCRADSHN
ncbi:uncharacterized protein LOC126742251 [Anthonomus grandis grandis]|uniref:uncharacterized protein LOC126742251 n=1 Tax=Anthonomus grandis grandis TaxID=2921223 RepID=UPI002164F240|nr:uncharacterized protein LOC126742251 [Anthonomus grandis grandis]